MQLSCSICGERYSAAHEASGTGHCCPGCLQLIELQGLDASATVPTRTKKRTTTNDFSLAVAVALGVAIGHLVVWITLGRPSYSNVTCSIVGGMTILLGMQGFSPQGLPWTGKTYITGTAAQVIGSFVLLTGLALLVFPGLLGKFLDMYAS